MDRCWNKNVGVLCNGGDIWLQVGFQMAIKRRKYVHALQKNGSNSAIFARSQLNYHSYYIFARKDKCNRTQGNAVSHL